MEIKNINNSFNPLINKNNEKKEVNDPFDLDMQVTDLKLNKNDIAPITSKSLCTPGCGMTGTGNSFCC
jgi:lantibiotic bacteriocin